MHDDSRNEKRKKIDDEEDDSDDESSSSNSSSGSSSGGNTSDTIKETEISQSSLSIDDYDPQTVTVPITLCLAIMVG